MAQHHRSLSFFGCREYYPLPHIFTGFVPDNNFGSCSIASPWRWASSSRDTLSLPRHWFLGLQHLVLVLHVVGGVGEGGERHGEGWKVGQGRRQQGGRDAEGPRQHRRRGKAQPLQLRLLETFRFCSPVLEPDFHLKMSPFQSMYHRFPRRMEK